MHDPAAFLSVWYLQTLQTFLVVIYRVFSLELHDFVLHAQSIFRNVFPSLRASASGHTDSMCIMKSVYELPDCVLRAS